MSVKEMAVASRVEEGELRELVEVLAAKNTLLDY
jgi:hypothetical protein